RTRLSPVASAARTSSEAPRNSAFPSTSTSLSVSRRCANTPTPSACAARYSVPRFQGRGHHLLVLAPTRDRSRSTSIFAPDENGYYCQRRVLTSVRLMSRKNGAQSHNPLGVQAPHSCLSTVLLL